MHKRRVFFLQRYYNIIVLALILVVLFSAGSFMLDGKPVISTEADRYDVESKEEHTALDQGDTNNEFLLRSIQHLLPGIGKSNTKKEGNFLYGLYEKFINKTFYISIKEPITFIKAQFPAAQLHHEKLVLASAIVPRTTLEENNLEKVLLEQNQLKLVLEPLDQEEAVGVLSPVEEATGSQTGVPSQDTGQTADDLGELEQGIYLINNSGIVDSLNNGQIPEDIERPKKVKFEEGKPHILIYHTHGTESYQPASEGNYHTLRKEYSVIRIGEIVTAELEKRGFNVIHDTTYHDYPSYNGSYSRSEVTAREILKKNPSIQVVFDIHRDGYDNIESNPNREQITRNNQAVFSNETTTKFQFVIGPAAPNRKEVETFAHFVKAVSDSKYPDFSKPVLVKPYGQFNQFLSNHYALIEVGSNANTIEEAERTAYYLADVLADSLNLIKE